MSKKSRIVWIMAGLAGWVFALFLLTESAFSETLAGIAAKNGSLTFFGWLIILFVTAVTWLMIWRMLKEIHCRTSISVLLALIIAICIGFTEAMGFGSEWFSEVFEPLTWIPIIMGLFFGCLLVLVFLRVMKIKWNRIPPNSGDK